MSIAVIARRIPARTGLIVSALAVALGGCTYAIVHGGEIDSARAAKVVAGIQRIRQLRFRSEVPMVVKTPAAAEAMLETELSRDYTDQQIEAAQAAGSMTGLYPANFDLKTESLKLLKNQVVGFYDPRTKQMVMVEGGPELGFWGSATEFMIQRDVAGEMILAHELTHALQDQHFDLKKKLDAVKNDDDEALALKSVAEGDATIAGFAYVMGRMDDSTLDTIISNLGEVSKGFAREAPGTPAGLSAPLLFQYTAGARFVAEAYRRGGWRAVDALYAKPPLSSHQIIHPQLYFDRPTPPVQIALKGYEKILPEWKRADEDDTFGELLLKVILERALGKVAPAVGLARHWAGDRMAVLRHGAAFTVIWIIVFDNARAAQRFAAVYSGILVHVPASAPDGVDRRGDAVLAVLGAGARQFSALAPAIWKASAIGSVPQAHPAPRLEHAGLRPARGDSRAAGALETDGPVATAGQF
jgi:hypothetical protein